jgi:hypothetical protein
VLRYIILIRWPARENMIDKPVSKDKAMHLANCCSITSLSQLLQSIEKILGNKIRFSTDLDHN